MPEHAAACDMDVVNVAAQRGPSDLYHTPHATHRVHERMEEAMHWRTEADAAAQGELQQQLEVSRLHALLEASRMQVRDGHRQPPNARPSHQRSCP